MTPRPIGCAVLGIGAFAAVLVAAVWVNLSAMQEQAGCPPRLRWDDRVYVASGPQTADPRPGGVTEEQPVRLGITLVGLTGRDLYGPRGTPERPQGAERPDRIALDCGDGSYQGYTIDS